MNKWNIFLSVYIVLDGTVCTTIPSDKKEYRSECAFQFTYMLFKTGRKSGHFNQKGEIEFLHNRVDREIYMISINEVKLQKNLFYTEDYEQQ